MPDDDRFPRYLSSAWRKVLRCGYGDLRAVMTAALAGDPMAKLAARFASRPTGDGLRAPARRGQKRALADLLDTDLDSL
jgi:hypothetical protein